MLSDGSTTYFGTYCGCVLEDECGRDQGHGNPICVQEKGDAQGTASCSCNEDWDGARSGGLQESHYT